MAEEARAALVQRMGGRAYLTDGGLETWLIFHAGLDLPQFAAFPLLRDADGRAAMRRYFLGFLDEAEALGMGFVLDTPTWRASTGWGARLGWDAAAVAEVNAEAVAFARDLARGRRIDVLINGSLGPHGDAYRPEQVMSAEAAQDYHAPQVAALAGAGVDLVTAATISSLGEAVGIARAAQAAGVPVVLSFTVETDGRLLGGETLAEVIAATDAETGAYPLWYGVNCAHPTHFVAELQGAVLPRLGLVRANASKRSHAELDEATELDAGDAVELAQDYLRLRAILPGLRVVGGCCGTDLHHVSAIGRRFAGGA